MFSTLDLNPDAHPFRLQLSLGLIRGHEDVEKFGINPDLDSGTLFEDIWDGGGDYPYQTTAQALEIISDDTNDDAGDTGQRIVRIFGLDTNWNRIQEDVTMNGTSAVALDLEYLRVYRIKGLTAGSSHINEGTITLRLASAGATQAVMLPDTGQSQMALYSIPAGYQGVIVDWDGTLASKVKATVVMDILVRTPGEDDDGSWNLKRRRSVTPDSPTPKPEGLDVVVPEKTDIRIRGDSDTNNIEFTAGFDIILVSTSLPTVKTQLVSFKDDVFGAGEKVLVEAQANKRPFVEFAELDKDGLGTSILLKVGTTTILTDVSAAETTAQLGGTHIGLPGETITVIAEGAGTGKYHITCGLVDEELKGSDLA